MKNWLTKFRSSKNLNDLNPCYPHRSAIRVSEGIDGQRNNRYIYMKSVCEVVH